MRSRAIAYAPKVKDCTQQERTQFHGTFTLKNIHVSVIFCHCFSLNSESRSIAVYFVLLCPGNFSNSVKQPGQCHFLSLLFSEQWKPLICCLFCHKVMSRTSVLSTSSLLSLAQSGMVLHQIPTSSLLFLAQSSMVLHQIQALEVKLQCNLAQFVIIPLKFAQNQGADLLLNKVMSRTSMLSTSSLLPLAQSSMTLHQIQAAEVTLQCNLAQFVIISLIFAQSCGAELLPMHQKCETVLSKREHSFMGHSH